MDAETIRMVQELVIVAGPALGLAAAWSLWEIFNEWRV
jgi:hypothetical protein